jgi:hypothetical protein
MRLYVPEIGDRLRLEKPWTFKLYYESRNEGLLSHFGFTYDWRRPTDDYEEVTLPKGTVIKVDRVYIRQGAMAYSSISFWAEGIGSSAGSFGKPKGSARFWAKLEDCNLIDFKLESAADKTKPGLWWDVKDIKRNGYTRVYNPFEKDYAIEKNVGRVFENGQSWSDPALYSVEVSYTEHRTFVRKDATNTILGVPTGFTYQYKLSRPDLVYRVKDRDGNLVGDYTSYASMQKGIREHYKTS